VQERVGVNEYLVMAKGEPSTTGAAYAASGAWRV